MYSNINSCSIAEMVGEEGSLKEKTLQIAVYTDGQSLEGVKAGLKLFPVSKLIILFETEKKNKYDPIPRELSTFSSQLKDTLELDVEVVPILGSSIEIVLEAVRNIYQANRKEFGDVMMNLTGGGRIMTCTSLSTAFFFGIRAFYVDASGSHLLPILKLGYNQMLSDTKIKILMALGRAGGHVSSLESLSEMTGLDKALVSRHINGAEDARGLLELGLVDISRKERGRIKVNLTTLGQIMLADRQE